MADVFISYKKEDRPLVERIAAALKAYQMDVWWDDALAGGQQFRRKIKDELRDAKAVIVVWSKRSVESDWVLDEADDAKGRGKLLPVRFASDFEVPFGFRQMQVEDLGQWNGTADEASFKKIVAQIEEIGVQKFNLLTQALGVRAKEASFSNFSSGLNFGKALFKSLASASFLGLPLERFLVRGLLAGALLTVMISFLSYGADAPPLLERLTSDATIAFPFFFIVRGVHQYVMYRKGAGTRRVFDPPFRFWIWLSALLALIYATIFEVEDAVDIWQYVRAFPIAFICALGGVMAIRVVVAWMTPKAGELASEKP